MSPSCRRNWPKRKVGYGRLIRKPPQLLLKLLDSKKVGAPTSGNNLPNASVTESANKTCVAPSRDGITIGAFIQVK
jgi:hypothetical protein